MFDIWSKEEPLAVEQYQKPNYKVENRKSTDELKNGVCMVCCSSNGIWFPNEKYAFQKSFIENDRYEWTRTKCVYATKTIYIRDIYKSWYVMGINSEVNSIDKLVVLIKNEAQNLPIVCIGASSGGYLAAILSFLLNAQFAIVFSPQFELNNKEAKGANSILQRYANDKNASKYYNLKPFLELSEVPIYYFCPINSEQDRDQYYYIKDCKCIKPFLFKNKRHGIVLFKSNLSVIISMKKNELEAMYQKYKGHTLSRFVFSINIVGVKKTIIDIWRLGIEFLNNIFT